MDAREFFPSKWLQAADIDGKPTYVIADPPVIKELVGDKEKPVLQFTDLDKGLVLNQTNTARLMEAFGNNTEKWAGQKVQLYIVRATYKNKEVPAIRLSPAGES